MDSDDFPVDANQRVIIFPVYLVQGEGGQGFALQAQGDGGYIIVLLTDQDSLDRYRHDLGIPERGAYKFNTPQELLAALRTLSPQVQGVCFDLLRTHRLAQVQTVRPMRIQVVRAQLAASMTTR